MRSIIREIILLITKNEVFIMKKFLAVIMAVMLVVSFGVSSTIVASAADTTIGSQQTTKKRVKPSATVNGGKTSDVEIDYDDDSNSITFTYTGDGDLEGWNFYDGDGNLLAENVDYTVVYDGNSAIVTVINSDIDEVVANALVKGVDSEGTTKKPGSSTSPDTGAMGLTGLAVAGAGVAVLAAIKRKSDAE